MTDRSSKHLAACDLQTSVTTLIELARDKDSGVRYWATWNPNMPTEILAELANDTEIGIRHVVARHPNASAETLIKLIQDKNIDVQHWVIRNPNCPEVVKMWLANSGYAGMTLAEFITATQETP